MIFYFLGAFVFYAWTIHKLNNLKEDAKPCMLTVLRDAFKGLRDIDPKLMSFGLCLYGLLCVVAYPFMLIASAVEDGLKEKK